jgi:hypothetical protein
LSRRTSGAVFLRYFLDILNKKYKVSVNIDIRMNIPGSVWVKFFFPHFNHFPATEIRTEISFASGTKSKQLDL